MAVALNCRIGSRSFNAEVKAFRETPDGPRLESFASRLELKVMNSPGKVFGSFESALDERLVDDHFRRGVRPFTPLPGFHLLSQRLEISLHTIARRTKNL